MTFRFFHSLRFRVLVGSLALLLVLFGVYSYFAIHFFTEQMMTYVLDNANRMSNVILKSTHYSMLLNRKEDVYQIINTIAQEPGVEGIRIYNKRGEIIFSTMTKEMHTIVDMNAEACFICHSHNNVLESVPSNNRTRIYSSANGNRILGLISPIRNEALCSNAACHAHPRNKTVLGVLDVRMSLEQIDANISEAQTTMLFYAIGMILLVSVASSVFLYFIVDKPVKKLYEGTQQISKGNLYYTIAVKTKDELGQLAQSFNEMTNSLRQAEDINREWAKTLEHRIQEKTAELQTIHQQILQIEKMASLGKLSATVAHELNNPLEAILTYAKLIARIIRKEPTQTELLTQITEEIELIARETHRCGTIVKNLLLFSKKQIGEMNIVPVQYVLEKAIELMQHHFQISGVELRTTICDSNPSLLCDENQIQQAFVALFVNAVEALPDGGTLSVSVRELFEEDAITIAISDSGIGIAQEDLLHIFEPFFTTKKEGQGVGLGLSIVYGIVERHGGKISVHSSIGTGTIFTLKFPRAGSNLQKV
ncbi:MAG: HAMP domain-containing protein [Ignavibacteria bacterium]|nr:HAMP domain-containing protein [Ignavibacteria bacterium]